LFGIDVVGGMAIWLESYSRLLSRICDGSIGRNPRNSDAPAAGRILASQARPPPRS